MKMNIIFSAAVASLFLLNGLAAGNPSKSNTLSQQSTVTTETATITCYVGGAPQTRTVSAASAHALEDMFTILAKANAKDPLSAETQQLQSQILVFAEDYGLLPAGLTAEEIQSQFTSHAQRVTAYSHHTDRLPLPYQSTSREFFCNFVSFGEGGALPIIILPRFIPIIMTPIPRLFVSWNTDYGVTSVGGLVSGTGFIAEGAQRGVALGFWGIGFSIFLPPFKEYGMAGYALVAKVSADYMEYYPPNNPPEIRAFYPLDGAQNVPVTTKQLQFTLSDADKDLMSYSVSTSPNIGAASGTGKDGTYSVDISGLQSGTEYMWHVEATDGKDTVTGDYTFTTEYLAPVISDPSPRHGANYVPITQAFLNFTLTDYQNDPIDWTVETSPYIGSGSGTHASNGRYSIPITESLQYSTTYTWYVNATDGTYWSRKVFTFTTTTEEGVPYIFAGGGTGLVDRYLKETLAKDMESSSYGGRIYTIAGDETYLYVGGGLGPNKIYQYWQSNLTKRTESPSYGDAIFRIIPYGDYVYAGGTAGDIKQYRKSDMSYTGRSASYGYHLRNMASDGTYIYAVGGEGVVKQYTLPNLGLRHTSQDFGTQLWSVASDGYYVYASGDCDVVYQFWASNMTQRGQTGSYGGSVRNIGIDNDYFYAVGDTEQRVHQYWPGNLTLRAMGEDYGGETFNVLCDGTYVYVAGAVTGQVWQYWPSNMTRRCVSDYYGDTIEALWCYDKLN